jgi:hypothetical protein
MSVLTLPVPPRALRRRTPAAAQPAPAPVPWPTITVLAVLMAFADGFVLTAIQGATGEIERAQHPFAFWMATSALLVPVFVLAVRGAISLSRRLVGPSLRAPWRVAVAALLIAVAGSAVGTGAVLVSAGYDYAKQTELGRQQMDMSSPVVVTPLPGEEAACTGPCAAQQAQFTVDERAARLGSELLLGVNLALVGWVVAMRGGRLETTRPRT